MNIVIVGLGLIGGSLAKAFKKYTSHHIIAIDVDKNVLNSALEMKAIDEIGNLNSLSKADVMYLCIYPNQAIKFIEENIFAIPKNCIVTDTCGIKTEICSKLSKLAQDKFIFIGSHPMAGKEKVGFYVSDCDLFKNASYIIVPCEAKEQNVTILSDLARSIGFKNIKLSTPEEHDSMIAFTSQIPHALACAYVNNPCCRNHKGFSAGSYKDVSRVANINEDLWTELFMSNRDSLINQLDILVQNLVDIKTCLETENFNSLKFLLRQGRLIKEELGE